MPLVVRHAGAGHGRARSGRARCARPWRRPVKCAATAAQAALTPAGRLTGHPTGGLWARAKTRAWRLHRTISFFREVPMSTLWPRHGARTLAARLAALTVAMGVPRQPRRPPARAAPRSATAPPMLRRRQRVGSRQALAATAGSSSCCRAGTAGSTPSRPKPSRDCSRCRSGGQGSITRGELAAGQAPLQATRRDHQGAHRVDDLHKERNQIAAKCAKQANRSRRKGRSRVAPPRR